MKITEYGAIRTASDIKRRKLGGSSSTSFADMLGAVSEEEISASASLSDVSPAAGINNMLSVQEISDEEISRKKLVQKGKDLLDSLERLRQQLLIGGVPLAVLQELGERLSLQRQMVNDPQLLAIIDDIELRAAVELAKLEMAAKDADTI